MTREDLYPYAKVFGAVYNIGFAGYSLTLSSWVAWWFCMGALQFFMVQDTQPWVRNCTNRDLLASMSFVFWPFFLLIFVTSEYPRRDD